MLQGKATVVVLFSKELRRNEKILGNSVKKTVNKFYSKVSKRASRSRKK